MSYLCVWTFRQEPPRAAVVRRDVQGGSRETQVQNLIEVCQLYQHRRFASPVCMCDSWEVVHYLQAPSFILTRLFLARSNSAPPRVSADRQLLSFAQISR